MARIVSNTQLRRIADRNGFNLGMTRRIAAELGVEIGPDTPIEKAVDRAVEMVSDGKADMVKAALTLLGVHRISECTDREAIRFLELLEGL